MSQILGLSVLDQKNNNWAAKGCNPSKAVQWDGIPKMFSGMESQKLFSGMESQKLFSGMEFQKLFSGMESQKLFSGMESQKLFSGMEFQKLFSGMEFQKLFSGRESQKLFSGMESQKLFSGMELQKLRKLCTPKTGRNYTLNHCFKITDFQTAYLMFQGNASLFLQTPV